jgi:penicillin-binding protein 1A
MEEERELLLALELAVEQVLWHNKLAKQLFHGEGSKFFTIQNYSKPKEWIIAIRSERQYTKNEIIAMYCNVYDFCNYSVGKSALLHKLIFLKHQKS